jgi:dihydropyrimidine dehydrogenase (NAD+) subunit PreA
MHYGYRIVDDMIEGLEEYLRSKNMQSVDELVGRAVPGFVEWGDLDLNHHVVAKIDQDKCIGCNLCHVACWDGAHQCIHLPGQEAIAGHVAPMAATAKRLLQESTARTAAGERGVEPYRVPWVDETECVGCNLCSFVCPVEHCITMVEQRRAPQTDTWHDRIASGRDHVPGGLADL